MERQAVGEQSKQALGWLGGGLRHESISKFSLWREAARSAQCPVQAAKLPLPPVRHIFQGVAQAGTDKGPAGALGPQLSDTFWVMKDSATPYTLCEPRGVSLPTSHSVETGGTF